MAELTVEQRLAVHNRGGRLLVSAAAGSGKTKVLVDRLASYLTDVNDPANLDDFLIITYTKAAAAELRGKIAAKLTELIAQEPNNRHLRSQMQRLYLTKISTVHSFCSDILREYAYRMDIPGDFRIAEETECAELQLQVIERILDEAYDNAASNPDFCALIDTQGLGRDDRQIPQILLKVYNSSRCHLNPEDWLDWCFRSMELEEVSDASETVWGQYLIKDIKQTLRLHIESLERCANLAADAGDTQKSAACLEQTVAQLKFLLSANTWDEFLSRKNVDWGRLTFGKAIKDTELAERIKIVRKNSKVRIERKLECFCNPSDAVLADLKLSAMAAKGLIALVKRFSIEYDRRKRARRVLDFGDLEQRMLDLLMGKSRSGPTAAAAEIGSKYREIMVDEYQDSNGVQDAIFEMLTRKNGNCFMVGDVKQSIYQFRLADPDIFIKKYNSYLPAEEAKDGEGRKVLLSKNFRSSEGVISAVNDVFINCMSENVGGIRYGENEMLREGIPHIALEEPEVELYGICAKEDTYSEEAEFVANRICQLLDGKHMVRNGDQLRPIVQDDIVILLRSPGSAGADFQYALEQHGIRCVSGGSTDLLQTEEIATLRAFLEVISNPMQDIPLIAVLASKVVGFSADELAGIRSQDYNCSVYEALQKSDGTKVQAFLRMLTELRTSARLLTIAELIQKIFNQTRLDSIYAAMEDGFLKTEHLQMFCQVATEYESSGQNDLSQFLDHLSALEVKGLIHPGQQQSSGAVTIMSIHKSKGLEFPVVFLCGLSRRFNMESANEQVLCHKELGLGLNCIDEKNRMRYPTIAKHAISRKIEAESISEELRVLYVAMTRPKDRLIMTYAAGNLEKKIQETARRIDLSDPVLLTSEVSCPGSWVLQTALRRTEAGALFAIGDRPDCVAYREPLWKIDVPEIQSTEMIIQAEETVEKSLLSDELLEEMRASLAFCYPYEMSTQIPSKQTATQLKGRIKDQEAAENTIQSYKHNFRKPYFIKNKHGGKEFGNAMHSVLQYIDYSKCVDEQGVYNEIQRLVAEEYISAEFGEIADAEKIAKLFQTDVGRRMRSGTEVYREFKFSILDDADKHFVSAADDKILLQGVVDCAILEEDGITIIDFKTDRVTDDTLESVADGYKAQVKLYAGALERIFGRQVREMKLYFFSVDRFFDIQAE